MNDSTILVLNGPGLAGPGIGGTRYGDLALDDIRDECSSHCRQIGLKLEFRQTDDQDEMLRWISNDSEAFAGLIINPVAHGQSDSVDLDLYRSALTMVAHLRKPVVEIHITNIFKNDELTRPLQVPEAEMGFICGLGLHSYLLAINAVAKRVQD